MPPGFLRYYGSYRYPTTASLDRAVTAAWSRYDEEDVPAFAKLGQFIKSGTRLHVDLTLPTHADVRFAAASMFEVLAAEAIEGIVQARHGSDHLDFFPSGDDD